MVRNWKGWQWLSSEERVFLKCRLLLFYCTAVVAMVVVVVLGIGPRVFYMLGKYCTATELCA